MNDAIDTLATSNGYLVYSISMSARDERKGLQGCRSFYTAKDCAHKAKYGNIPKGAVIKMSDVDYYVEDLPNMLATGRPILLSTFVPMMVAGPVADGRYKTTADNKVVVNVLGDAEYEHKLWNYASDHVVVDKWWGSIVYLVEQVVYPEDRTRRVIGLFPARVIYGPIGWFIPGRRLQRRNMLEGNFAVNRFLVSETAGVEEYISISVPGESTSVTLPTSYAIAYFDKAMNSKEFPLATIEGNIRNTCSETMSSSDKTPSRPFWKEVAQPATDVMLLRRVFDNDRRVVMRSRTPMSLPKSKADGFSYQCYTSTDTLSSDGTPSMRAVVPIPLAAGAASPMASEAGDRVTITERINRQINTTKVAPTDKMNRRATWFIRKIVGIYAGLGAPVDVEDVERRQDRPSQRTIYQRWRLWLDRGRRGAKARIASFMKREAYSKITAPRNISTLPGDVKIAYSTYIYALVDAVFHDLPWYAFSKTPVEIARRVGEVVAGAKFVVPTDFSKFDGTHGEWLCSKELELLLTFFNEKYHKEVKDLFSSQYNTVGYTKFGLKYNTGHTRLSGSPETSMGNTFDDALVAFLALCELQPDTEAGFENAYARLGVYGGDDGLTADVPPATYEKVAAKLGLKLKAERLVRPEPVPFLSRLYPQVWDGHVGSFTEPLRQLSKFHLTTTTTDVSGNEVLARKAQAYLLTDGKTPVISQLCTKLLELCPGYTDNDGREVQFKQDLSWFSQYDYSVQFPQVEDIDLANDIVASCLKVDVATMLNAVKRIQEATSLSEVFYETVFGAPPKVEVPAIVGQELVHVEQPVNNNDNVQKAAEEKLAVELQPKIEHLAQHKNKPIPEPGVPKWNELVDAVNALAVKVPNRVVGPAKGKKNNKKKQAKKKTNKPSAKHAPGTPN